MVKLIWIHILFICLFSQQSFAQKDSLDPYMVSYAEKVIVSASFQSNTESFVLSQQIEENKHNLEFYPNIKNQITFGLTYKMIDISFGYTPWFFKSNADKYKASNFNFSYRFNHKKWYQSVSFVKQKGFFTEFLDDKSLYLPSFRSIKIGGTTSYVFNDKFSFSALFNQNQWQIKSAGSFVPNFSFFYTSFENKDDKADFNLEMYSFSLTPSYYYTWVIDKRVFLSGGAGVGAGVEIHNKKTSPVCQVIFNSKLGYNTTSFYSYLEVNNTNFIFNENRARLDDTSLNALVAVGFRFDPPKKAKKLYDNTYNFIQKKIKKETKSL